MQNPWKKNSRNYYSIPVCLDRWKYSSAGICFQSCWYAVYAYQPVWSTFTRHGPGFFTKYIRACPNVRWIYFLNIMKPAGISLYERSSSPVLGLIGSSEQIIKDGRSFAGIILNLSRFSYLNSKIVSCFFFQHTVHFICPDREYDTWIKGMTSATGWYFFDILLSIWWTKYSSDFILLLQYISWYHSCWFPSYYWRIIVKFEQLHKALPPMSSPVYSDLMASRWLMRHLSLNSLKIITMKNYLCFHRESAFWIR